ncbi:MAG: MoxR family ATPase [Blastocatellia bacterium]|nr:MoxR family ATPase [Blastocatellia bacterium]
MRKPTFTYECALKAPDTPFPKAHDKPEPYIASEPLKRAVNLAIALERPLLVEGEAGCGKSRLARAVAYELGLPLFVWNVRSTSKAVEGLYGYDAILRLHDVQVQQRGGAVAKRDPQRAEDYRKFGPLGDAFRLASSPGVVLIDEIDKADLDFPNDLLTVLDDPWSFDIPETGEAAISALHKPIVIVTSNKEKGNLPLPFLRRCVYFALEFPGPEELERIVEEHFRAASDAPTRELVREAASRFDALRKEGGLYKKPGTSEFLDWMTALHAHGVKPEALREAAKPPFPELLFKLRADFQKHASA